MIRWIAFLRAVNTTGRYLKMEDLRRLFAACGFSNVQTFIQTGNVIFDSGPASPGELEARLEQHLQQALGYPVETFLRSPAELAEIAALQPFPQAGQDSLTIAFLKAALTPEQQTGLAALKNGVDDFHVQGREVYWVFCRKSFKKRRVEIRQNPGVICRNYPRDC